MNLFADCLSSPVITLALQLIALSLLGLTGTFLARRQSAMRRKTIAFGAIAAIGLIIPFFLIFQLTGSGIFRPDAGNMQPLPPTAPVRPAPPANQTEAVESDGSGADTAGSASGQPHVRLSGRRLSQAILSLWGNRHPRRFAVSAPRLAVSSLVPGRSGAVDRAKIQLPAAPVGRNAATPAPVDTFLFADRRLADHHRLPPTDNHHPGQIGQPFVR